MTRRRPMLRPAVGQAARPTTRLGPGAAGGSVGAPLPTAVAMRPTRPTVARRIVVAGPRPAVLTAPVTGLPVLLVSLGPSVASARLVASTAVTDVTKTITALASSSRAAPVALTIGRRRAPASRDAAMTTVLLEEAAEAKRMGSIPARRRVVGLGSGPTAVRIAKTAPAQLATGRPAPALAALATSTVRKERAPTAPAPPS